MKTLLTLLALAVPTLVSAQTFQTHMQAAHDPLSESNMRAVVYTDDGGYAYSGTHEITVLPSGIGRPLLNRLDPSFGLLWAQTYVTAAELADPNAGGPELTAEDLIQTQDGGYVIAGRAIDEVAGSTMGFLLRTDGLGDVVWMRMYPNTDGLTSVAEAADGLVAVGVSPTQRAVLISTEQDGNARCSQEVWTAKRRDPGNARYAKVIPYVDGQFAAVGTTGNIRWDSDVLLTVFDDACRITLNRAYGETSLTSPGGTAFGLRESGDSIAWDRKGNHLVITGTHRTACIDNCVDDLWEDILAFRVDKAGQVEWARRFDVQGRPDHGVDLTIGRGLGRRTRAPQLWITGRAESDHLAPGNFSDDAFLLQLERVNGTFQGFEVFGDQAFDAAYSVITNADANVVLLGDSNSFNASHAETYLIERYSSVLGVCRDLPVRPDIIDIELPIMKTLIKAAAQPSIDPPWAAVPAPVNTRDLCPKRQVR